jgi:hypothetical protein
MYIPPYKKKDNQHVVENMTSSRTTEVLECTLRSVAGNPRALLWKFVQSRRKGLRMTRWRSEKRV